MPDSIETATADTVAAPVLQPLGLIPVGSAGAGFCEGDYCTVPA